MIRFFTNLIGLCFLVLAAITAVLDLTRTIANSTLTLTPLGLEWRNFDVESLQYFQVGVERHLGLPWVWTNIIQTVLLWPSALVFVLFAALFLWLGKRPERRWRKRFGR